MNNYFDENFRSFDIKNPLNIKNEYLISKFLKITDNKWKNLVIDLDDTQKILLFYMIIVAKHKLKPLKLYKIILNVEGWSKVKISNIDTIFQAIQKININNSDNSIFNILIEKLIISKDNNKLKNNLEIYLIRKIDYEFKKYSFIYPKNILSFLLSNSYIPSIKLLEELKRINPECIDNKKEIYPLFLKNNYLLQNKDISIDYSIYEKFFGIEKLIGNKEEQYILFKSICNNLNLEIKMTNEGHSLKNLNFFEIIKHIKNNKNSIKEFEYIYIIMELLISKKYYNYKIDDMLNFFNFLEDKKIFNEIKNSHFFHILFNGDYIFKENFLIIKSNFIDKKDIINKIKAPNISYVKKRL